MEHYKELRVHTLALVVGKSNFKKNNTGGSNTANLEVHEVCTIAGCG